MCNVLPLKPSDIIMGPPWLVNWDVHHHFALLTSIRLSKVVVVIVLLVLMCQHLWNFHDL